VQSRHPCQAPQSRAGRLPSALLHIRLRRSTSALLQTCCTGGSWLRSRPGSSGLPVMQLCAQCLPAHASALLSRVLCSILRDAPVCGPPCGAETPNVQRARSPSRRRTGRAGSRRPRRRAWWLRARRARCRPARRCARAPSCTSRCWRAPRWRACARCPRPCTSRRRSRTQLCRRRGPPLPPAGWLRPASLPHDSAPHLGSVAACAALHGPPSAACSASAGARAPDSWTQGGGLLQLVLNLIS